jgi:hypothetical protein
MYENVWDRQSLLFQIKLLKDRVEAFESGEKYIRMEKLHQIAREGDFRTIQRLKKELAEERADRIRVRENWYATCLDIEKDCNEKLRQKDKECAQKIAEKDRIIQMLQKELEEELEEELEDEIEGSGEDEPADDEIIEYEEASDEITEDAAEEKNEEEDDE